MKLSGALVKKVTTTLKKKEEDEITVYWTETQIVLDVRDLDPNIITELNLAQARQVLESTAGVQLEMIL